MSEQKRLYLGAKEALEQREEHLKTTLKKYDDNHKKLIEVERRADSLDIELKSLTSQTDIQRRQLMDKIQQQRDLIAAEKDTKEVWVGRYEREQKAHIETHTALLELRAEMQEATVKFENQRTLAESLESIKQSLTGSHEEMQR